MLEGYGQTECGAAATLTTPGDMSVGHVGPPLACCDIKLVDVSDMNYYAANGEGEVGPAKLTTPILLLVWAWPGLFQGPQCVWRLSQEQREDSRGPGRGGLVAFRGYREVATKWNTQNLR